MPPTGKLSRDKVATLTRWVSLGAPWPSRDRAAHAPRDLTKPSGSKFTASDRASGRFNPFAGRTFRPSVDPQPRRRPNGHAIRSIDFIWKGLVENGLTPAAEADKQTLIRRATFDMTGLPPTIEEIDMFRRTNHRVLTSG